MPQALLTLDNVVLQPRKGSSSEEDSAPRSRTSHARQIAAPSAARPLLRAMIRPIPRQLVSRGWTRNRIGSGVSFRAAARAGGDMTPAPSPAGIQPDLPSPIRRPRLVLRKKPAGDVLPRPMPSIANTGF